MPDIDIKSTLNNLSSILDASHVFMLLSALAFIILFFIGILLKKRREKIDGARYHIFISIYIAVILLVLLSAIYTSLVLYFPKYANYPHVHKILLLALSLIVGVIVYQISILAVIDMRKVLTKALNRELDDIIVKWISIAIKVLISIIVFFTVLKIFNINITTLVAGLGIGGIAVALAAQDTMSNILGCAIIILDKPFVLGNRVKILEYDGTVEAIGLRSIRIRTFDGSVVVVPNKTVSNVNIENITSRMSIRQVDEINIEPLLDNNQLQNLVENIKDILKDHMKIKNDYNVFFDKRNAVAITIKVVYYVDTIDYVEYMQAKEEINYLIYGLLTSKNIKYAYPSSLVYVNNK